jgi:catechol 2,3-dioxygenase-like lactoylglutathione lyase family enzyme
MFLEHVNMTVTDLDRSIGFYGKALGLRVRWRGTNAEGAPAAHVGDERNYLALFESGAKGSRGEPDYGQTGLNHFGWVVEDLDSAKARLAELGIQPHHEADYEPGRRAYFFDPDGIEIELVEYSK